MSNRSIATRTGDKGTTALLYGQRVPKSHPQIEAVGTLDELNAAIGLAKAHCVEAADREQLEAIQKDLINLMGEVVCAETDLERYASSKFVKITEADLERIDQAVGTIESRSVSFKGWATPGANPAAATLEVARTIARRSERRLVGLSEHGRQLRPLLLSYINRMADLLWLMARAAEPQD